MVGIPREQEDMGMVHFICPSCGKKLKTDASGAGKRVRCPRCGTKVTVPVHVQVEKPPWADGHLPQGSRPVARELQPAALLGRSSQAGGGRILVPTVLRAERPGQPRTRLRDNPASITGHPLPSGRFAILTVGTNVLSRRGCGRP